MNSVFINQTKLQITLTSGVNIVGATTTSMKYRKPNGITGELVATVENAASGVLSYEFPVGSSLLDKSGIWRFWNYIVFADGRVARGETYEVEIFNDKQ